MALNLKEYDDKLLFIPLGGSNEIGMNLNVYRYRGKYLLIDFGMGFAGDYLPGVELVLPDISFLIEHKKNILGLVLTHAHEDHIGAVPYLWNELECPMYATPFTAALLHHKFSEEGNTKGQAMIKELKAGASIDLAPFKVDMVPLTHSIPEMQAMAVVTNAGTVIHTGDWKFDPNPMLGPVSDEDALSRYGKEGVLAMVCDSTNVFVEGDSGSESDVRKNLVEVVKSCQQRVVVTTFASNVARLESILIAAREAGRKVALAGRSLHRIYASARESGYLQEDYDIVSDEQVMQFPRSQVLIIATGCQGEPLAALTKMARDEHPRLRLAPGDTVIFSSRRIPGNEMKIGWVHNRFIDKGVEVITEGSAHIHVSGHPAREELKRMYQLVRPHIAVPTHGEPRHIHEQAKLAYELQVPHAIEARNGSVILLEKELPRMIGTVEAGYTVVDGHSIIPADSAVIKMRRKLREDGCVVVAAAIHKKSGRLASPVRVTAPGCLDATDDADILDMLAEEITAALEDQRDGSGAKKAEEVVRAAVRRVMKDAVGKKPVIEVQWLSV